MRVPEAELPTKLDPFAAVELAYPDVLIRVQDALRRRLPVLIECDKELTPYLYKCLRDRLKRHQVRCAYLDGRPTDPAGPQGLLAVLVAQIRDAVRAGTGDQVLVLPHLDLLASSHGGLTAEAREVIGLLYENPTLLWVGFSDPSFALPPVLRNLFPHHEAVLGVDRGRLGRLVTQREARKLGEGGLAVHALYRWVSGAHAVRLRRVLSSLEGEDYPADPSRVHAQLRAATLGGELTVPDIGLHEDIGGYAKVKERIQREILDILAHKDTLQSEAHIKQVEALVPRGMIFWGPPGTGKTLFAKAMASSLGAAVLVVSGPELKSKWHGESEQNIRRLFLRARQSAPSILVFDELDAIASARGAEAGDGGVGHSMVNQLLTELDGFRSNEMVFVVGTTNLPERLDPALLRPGRFEFTLQVPYPDAEDREAILRIYAARFGLQLDPAGLAYAVKRTGGPVEGGQGRYTGDHLEALCRALARQRIREGRTGTTGPADVDLVLDAALDRPDLSPDEERVVATHEAGHAVVALRCAHLPPIDRISIRGDLGGALGYVAYGDSARRHVQTRSEMLDRIAVLFGGREAEDLLLDDLSFGSAADLEQATGIARWLVEQLAIEADALGVRAWDPRSPRSEQALADAEARVHQLLAAQRARARAILEADRELVQALTALLLERKVLDRAAFSHLIEGP